MTEPAFELIQDGFYDQADALRAVFDERFADVRSTRGDRFVWDYWHVPDQYTLLRTPAWEYFPQEQYERFHTALVLWGRKTLGCWDVSPPWMSCYVEGCQQQLHSDVPHGPWAFVYSLTPQERRFQGGQTEILREETLDYWAGFNDAEDRELKSFVQRIEPDFNRLIVFDPRFPHGVSRVSGTHDPRAGRLVIHGWFTEPKVFVEGAHSDEQIAAVLDPGVEQLAADVADLGPIHGFLSVRLTVAADGVTAARVLANTLVNLDDPGENEAEAVERILKVCGALTFSTAEDATEVTLPLLFR